MVVYLPLMLIVFRIKVIITKETDLKRVYLAFSLQLIFSFSVMAISKFKIKTNLLPA